MQSFHLGNSMDWTVPVSLDCTWTMEAVGLIGRIIFAWSMISCIYSWCWGLRGNCKRSSHRANYLCHITPSYFAKIYNFNVWHSSQFDSFGLLEVSRRTPFLRKDVKQERTVDIGFATDYFLHVTSEQLLEGLQTLWPSPLPFWKLALSILGG